MIGRFLFHFDHKGFHPELYFFPICLRLTDAFFQLSLYDRIILKDAIIFISCANPPSSNSEARRQPEKIRTE
jgi:hypothetical protein